MYFTGDDSYQNFPVFALMLSSLTLEQEKNSGYQPDLSPEKIKSFDTNFEPTMSNLANGTVILKLKNSVLVQNVLLYYIVSF